MISEDRIILHSDVNNFYASVEMRLNPALQGKSVAVCGKTEDRHGIVLAKSNSAKEKGVKTGDTIWQAKMKCPDLIVVPPHYSHYTKFSNIIFNIYTHYTDLVEPFGLDECWLDVTASSSLFGSGEEIANKISSEIKEKTGLSVSIGVSYNKIFAKLGSDMKKPAGITVITKENYKQKVWSLPVKDMLMIGKSTEKKLALLNIKTIGDLANTDINLLKEQFGINGEKMKIFASGEDCEKVKNCFNRHIPESVGHGTTPPKDIVDYNEAKTVIYALCEMISTRLRKYGLDANGVSLSIKYPDLTKLSRQTSLDFPTSNTTDIAKAALTILNKYHDFSVSALRAVTVSTFKLISKKENRQLSIFTQNSNKEDELENCVDDIRSKYGFNKIIRGNQMLSPKLTSRLLEDEDFIPFSK